MLDPFISASPCRHAEDTFILQEPLTHAVSVSTFHCLLCSRYRSGLWGSDDVRISQQSMWQSLVYASS